MTPPEILAAASVVAGIASGVGVGAFTRDDDLAFARVCLCAVLGLVGAVVSLF